MKTYDAVTIGNSLIDAFLHVKDDNMHAKLDEAARELRFKYGEKIHVDSCDFLVGGNATNVGVGLSRLGFNTSLFAEIGDDEFSRKIMNLLSQESINLANIKITKGTSASFAVGINFKGERTLFVNHVKRTHNFSFENIETKYVYLTSLGEEWKDAYRKTLELVQKTQAKLAFSPGTHQLGARVESFRDILSVSDFLFVNKEEAARIMNYESGIRNQENGDIKELLIGLQKMGPKIVSVTDGTNGSFALDENGKMWQIGLYPHESIERTGAGDAYATGFLGAIMSELLVPEAMRFGAANAASVVTKVGSQPGLLSKEEIQNMLSKYPDFQAKAL